MSCSFIHPTNIHQMSTMYQSLFWALEIQQYKNKTKQNKKTPCPGVAWSLKRFSVVLYCLSQHCLPVCFPCFDVSYPLSVFIQCLCSNLASGIQQICVELNNCFSVFNGDTACGISKVRNNMNTLLCGPPKGNVGPEKRERFVEMTQVCRTEEVVQGHRCRACVSPRSAQDLG